MNTKLLSLAITAMLALLGSAHAQGTAFTYQGRLNDGANAAYGIYDFSFALFDAGSAGNQVSGVLTNAATAVSNGLFILTLDFGDQFPGADRWLEIGVRTNGGGVFTTLAPRQRLTATPYAIFAGHAQVAVTASNFTGTIGLGQLPAAVVTNGTSGVNFTGTFSGNGSGLTNIPGAFPQQFASGTNVSAQANRVYNLTNSALVNLSLPTNANVGDIIQINALSSGNWVAHLEGSPVGPAGENWTAHGFGSNWLSLCMSVDGTKMFAGISGDRMYSSSDTGTNWAVAGNSFPGVWNSVACSADGSKVVGALGSQLYTSSDGGSNWTVGITVFGTNIPAVAISTDGSRMFAVGRCDVFFSGFDSLMLYSEDSGATWSPRTNAPKAGWNCVAMSADGSRLIAAAGWTAVSGTHVSPLWISTDYGLTWSAHGPTNYWLSVASSANGARLSVVSSEACYTSSDFGASWVAHTNGLPVGYLYRIASSSDGTKLVVGGYQTQLFTSSDSGLTWAGHGPTNLWSSVASSSDGTTFAAAALPGQIYTSFGSIPFEGGPGTSVELRYAANGRWEVLTAGNGDIPNLDASQITTGTFADARLSANVAQLDNSQTFTGAKTFNNAANSFTGNGAGLTSLSANQLTSGQVPADVLGNAWKVAGNDGTTPGTHFLGTTDNQPLELKVNNDRALRLEPTATNALQAGIVNVIAGSPANTVGAGVIGATISGGGAANWLGNARSNRVDADFGSVGGGHWNTISSLGSTIGGGFGNVIQNSAFVSTIAGGDGNTIQPNASYSTIGGGQFNGISGSYGTVPGGDQNVAGASSFAAGHRAKANHTGSFVWADPADSDFATTADRQFLIRASGGVGIGTTSPGKLLHVGNTDAQQDAMIRLATGNGSANRTWTLGVPYGGTDATGTNYDFIIEDTTAAATRFLIEWNTGNVGIGTTSPTNKLHVDGGVSATAFVTTSDRNAKENFASVSPQEVLNKVAALPITTWNFKTMNDGRHMGPMAQDFYAAFGLGGGNTTITSMDPDGVALAAIQGLNQKLVEELKRQDAENAELKARLERLERVLSDKIDGGAK